ncbi:MAG: molybdopterin-dependent oxidoreductase [Desulfobacterales bacterium]|nr:molybdopterin-dependent oxidoreductase [Desulfobacterales bacterium]
MVIQLFNKRQLIVQDKFALASARFTIAIVNIFLYKKRVIISRVLISYAVPNVWYDAYEIGQAINPLKCKEQIHGGAAMGIGIAPNESAHPYWPSPEYAVDSFESYVIATAADVPPESQYAILDNPHPDGPFGAKGFCESSTNVPVPAIIAAIHNAVGVWITQFPATPETVLKALAKRQ